MTYRTWELEELLKEIDLYEEYYKEFGNNEAKMRLAELRKEVSKRNLVEETNKD